MCIFEDSYLKLVKRLNEASQIIREGITFDVSVPPTDGNNFYDRHGEEIDIECDFCDGTGKDPYGDGEDCGFVAA